MRCFAWNSLCFWQQQKQSFFRNTNQLCFVDAFSRAKFMSMPFCTVRMPFDKLLYDYSNFHWISAVCIDLGKICRYSLVRKLSLEQFSQAWYRRKILPTTSSSISNFSQRPTTVRNVETIYRWALELVIILLLLRFHSVIGVTATSQ